jgi:hypothetical protein
MRRTRTRKRRRKQRGGSFFGALSAGLEKGLGALGLRKKEPITGPPTAEIQNTSVNIQEGGKRRRRKSSRRKSRRRKSRRSKSSRRKSRRRKSRRSKRRRR